MQCLDKSTLDFGLTTADRDPNFGTAGSQQFFSYWSSVRRNKTGSNAT